MKLEPIFLKEIPSSLEEGKLYISKEYGVSIHLCICGCKNKTVLPFKEQPNPIDNNHWGFVDNNGIVTFSPSILNSGLPCKSHYYIIDNNVILC